MKPSEPYFTVSPGDSDANLGVKSTELAQLTHFTHEKAAACGHYKACPGDTFRPRTGVHEVQPIALLAIPNHLLSCVLQIQPFTTGTERRVGGGEEKGTG